MNGEMMSIAHPAHFTVEGRRIGARAPAFVIAEIGINHGGDAELCARMIEAAAAAGADSVKLQVIDADESYVAGTASHKEFSGKGLSAESLAALTTQARALGMVMFATPGDFSSLERMVGAGMELVKISSGLMTNLPLIRRAGQMGLPMIISTGMARLDEARGALDAALGAGSPGVAVLHATSLYPCPPERVNLRAMATLAAELGVPVGYSDHVMGELACVSAVAMGAAVIEKHFTLDRSMPGGDNFLSAEPGEFAAMVRHIRDIEIMLGRDVKEPTPEESERRSQVHRCLVARMSVAPGEEFTAANVGLKRPLPGTAGLPAGAYDTVLGRRAAVALDRDQPIRAEHVAGLPDMTDLESRP